MTVAEMMERIDAEEIAEWIAYEKVVGPLGPRYSEDKLAEILEQLKLSNFLFGEVNKEKGKDNPIPPPRPEKRPFQLFDPDPEPDDEPEEGVYYDEAEFARDHFD